jgi:hypothetical protein
MRRKRRVARKQTRLRVFDKTYLKAGEIHRGVLGLHDYFLILLEQARNGNGVKIEALP